MRKFTLLAIIGITFLTAISGIPGKTLGKRTYIIPKDLESLSPVEKWVIERIQNGDVADLKGRFGKRKPLRAKFVTALLRGGFKDLEVPNGVQIKDAIIREPLELGFANLEHNVAFFECLFEGDVIFRNSHFSKSLWLIDSTFLGEADFHGIKIDYDFLTNGSNFMQNYKKSKELLFSGSFCNIKVGRNLSINKTIFYRPVYFVAAEIEGQFIANKAIFFALDNSNFCARFNNMKVKGEAIFNGSIFYGLVDFVRANIGGQFHIINAYFQYNKQNEENKTESLKINDFRRIKVEKEAYFIDSVFIEEIALANATLGDLIIRGEQYRPNISTLDLVNGTIYGNLEMSKVKLNRIEATRLNVKHQALFNDVEISALADFRNSDFGQLTRINNSWVNEKRSIENWEASGKEVCKGEGIWLDGMSYKCIDAGEMPGCSEEKKCDEYLNLINNAQFNFTNYIQLESYFRRCGMENLSDAVYIAGKRVELWPKKGYEWLYPNKWLKIFFWDLLTGYGRRPIQAFLFIIPILIVGIFLFNPKYLTGKSWQKGFSDRYPICGRVFLSFDRFIPVINLGFKDCWEPKPKEIKKSIWIWWHLQYIFGWILIPIVLAAIAIR